MENRRSAALEAPRLVLLLDALEQWWLAALFVGLIACEAGLDELGVLVVVLAATGTLVDFYVRAAVTLQDILEHLEDVVAGYRGCLLEAQSMLYAEIGELALRDGTGLLARFHQVYLVGDQAYRDVLVAVGLDVVKPLHDIFEGLALGDIEDEHGPLRFAVVAGRDRLVLFCSGCITRRPTRVPDLDLELLVGIREVHDRRYVFDADCRWVVAATGLVLADHSVQQARLAHAAVAN